MIVWSFFWSRLIEIGKITKYGGGNAGSVILKRCAKMSPSNYITFDGLSIYSMSAKVCLFISYFFEI